MILSDLAKYPMTRSVARSLCDSWAFCLSLSDGVHQASVFIHHVQIPLDWIGVQSNWFSLAFSRSTFQTIPAFEYPLSSTSMFLRHTIPYSKIQIRLLSFTLTSSFLSVILVVYWMLLFQWLFHVSLPHDSYSLLWLHFLNTQTVALIPLCARLSLTVYKAINLIGVPVYFTTLLNIAR